MEFSILLQGHIDRTALGTVDIEDIKSDTFLFQIDGKGRKLTRNEYLEARTLVKKAVLSILRRIGK